MRKILVTGGTTFVSRTLAEYFVAQNDDVFALNRGNHPQSKGVTLIKGDRHDLGNLLENQVFDVVIDANAYTAEEVNLLLDALPSVKDYVLISTSAVYPETVPQPITEEEKTGPNSYWKGYGTNKIEAENALTKRVPDAYIIRPAYIYGPYNNIYREAFVFDRAKAKSPFYIPGTGQMLLQFIYMEDICRLVDQLITTRPKDKVYNAGNPEMISIKDWVTSCYEIVGEKPTFIEVDETIPQTKYFSFTDYQYELDVSKQMDLIKETTKLKDGLKKSYEWYQNHEKDVTKRDYSQFIEEEL